MACSSVANIRIEPVDVTWKEYEQECWEFEGATASGLGGKYVVLYSAAGVGYYAWFDENNTDTDPAPGGGLTEIEVDYAASATPAAIATAFGAAVGAVAGFDATVDGTHVNTIRTAFGACTDSTLGNVGALVELSKEADGKDVYLGLLEGDVSVSFEEATLELTAHQTGTSVRADLRQGVNATVSLTLKESDNALRKDMFTGSAGGAVTGATSEVFGWGTLKQGLSTIVDAGKLVMHPVALASSDKSRDLCFWKSYPLISTLTFSGENPEVMEIEFKCYIDDAKAEGINLFAFGDWSQAGLDA
jgi:hypothetical protein